MWAYAFDVPVGQVALVVQAEGLVHGVGVEVALFEQAQKYILGDFGVVLGVRGGEQVEADAESFPGVQELGLELGVYVFGGDALLVGGDGDGRAVRVAAGDHGHFVAHHAVIAREDVGGQVSARRMAEMDGAVGVGPGDGYKDSFRHE